MWVFVVVVQSRYMAFICADDCCAPTTVCSQNDGRILINAYMFSLKCNFKHDFVLLEIEIFDDSGNCPKQL